MTGVKTRIGTRKSVAEKTITPPKSRRRSSIENGSSVKKTRYSFDPSKLSPTALIKKLDTVSKDELLHGHSDGSAAVELKGLGDDLISTEDYEKMRENVRQKVSNPENFDSSGKTEINTAGAVLAGAKMVIDEVRSTRSMCKKLKEDCGVEEDEVLYQPLSYLGAVNKTCQEIMENRQASVAELYVDYKKQLSFKSNVLEHVVSKQVKKGSKTENRGLRVKNQLPPPMTPANGIVINPLDVEKIISNYALEVASTVRENRKPRRIAPIPFDINCLDDEEDE